MASDGYFQIKFLYITYFKYGFLFLNIIIYYLFLDNSPITVNSLSLSNSSFFFPLISSPFCKRNRARNSSYPFHFFSFFRHHYFSLSFSPIHPQSLTILYRFSHQLMRHFSSSLMLNCRAKWSILPKHLTTANQ